MAVELNHTIIPSRDPAAGAAFLAEILGLPEPKRFGPFHEVRPANGVSLDYMRTDGDVPSIHYAFLISEQEFDEVFGRIVERGVAYYADSGGKVEGEINTNDGGRGCYFYDPDGHWLEIITQPYGWGAS